MINNAEEFIQLRITNDDRANSDFAPDEVWLDVMQKYPDFKEWVAHNKTVKGEILTILSNDQNARVRNTIARRRATTPEILQKLSKDPDESVRLRVALNAKVTKEILLTMLDDEWYRVVEEVKIKLKEKFNFEID